VSAVEPGGAARASAARAPAGSGAVRVIALFALRESLRRRVFAVVFVLTLAFLGLYAWGTAEAFQEVDDLATSTAGVDADIVAGATLLGLGMFATLFLGTILAVFLTLGAIRGDAERGLLQPLLVRPVGRRTFLLARFLAAASVCALYVIAVFLACMVITGIAGGWWPDRVLGPALGLAAGVAILAALSLAGSVFLASTANGIAVFMLFGAGLTAGLLGQIGEAIGSETLDSISQVATWLLPFEGLYQAGLAQLTADTVGFTRLAVDLGPFGGAEAAGTGLWLWSVAYLGLVGVVALAGFTRRDL
jgi:ABC-type transport system involved in multi-copper enzyme maturation permease subunit